MRLRKREKCGASVLRRIISAWPAFTRARNFRLCELYERKKRKRTEEKKNFISARPSWKISREAFLASAKRVVFSNVYSRFINYESTTYYIKKKKRITPFPRGDRSCADRTSSYQDGEGGGKGRGWREEGDNSLRRG